MARIEIAAEGDRKAFTIYANRIESLNAFLSTPEEDATLGDKVKATAVKEKQSLRRCGARLCLWANKRIKAMLLTELCILQTYVL